MIVNTPNFSDNFFMSESFKLSLMEQIYSQKRINIPPISQDPDGKVSKDNKCPIPGIVNDIFTFIQYVNSKPENTQIICGRPIADIVIPAEFKEFVLPNAVRYDIDDRLAIDLLERPNPSEVLTEPDYNNYLNKIALLRGLVKRPWNEGLVTLDSLRNNVTLSEVFPRIMVHLTDIGQDAEGKHIIARESYNCHYDKEVYVPIVVKGAGYLYSSDYFNTSVSFLGSEFVKLFDIN